MFFMSHEFFVECICACARRRLCCKVTQTSQQNEAAQTTSKEKSITILEKSRGKQRPGGQSDTDHQ